MTDGRDGREGGRVLHTTGTKKSICTSVEIYMYIEGVKWATVKCIYS